MENLDILDFMNDTDTVPASAPRSWFRREVSSVYAG